LEKYSFNLKKISSQKNKNIALFFQYFAEIIKKTNFRELFSAFSQHKAHHGEGHFLADLCVVTVAVVDLLLASRKVGAHEADGCRVQQEANPHPALVPRRSPQTRLHNVHRNIPRSKRSMSPLCNCYT